MPGLGPVPPGAKQPELTEGVLERLNPYNEDLFDRIRAGESLEQVVENIALRANVTPGQVTLYVFLLTQTARTNNSESSGVGTGANCAACVRLPDAESTAARGRPPPWAARPDLAARDPAEDHGVSFDSGLSCFSISFPGLHRSLDPRSPQGYGFAGGRLEFELTSVASPGRWRRRWISVPEAGSWISCVCQSSEAVTWNAARFLGNKVLLLGGAPGDGGLAGGRGLEREFRGDGADDLELAAGQESRLRLPPFSLVSCNSPSFTARVPLRACQP